MQYWSNRKNSPVGHGVAPTSGPGHNFSFGMHISCERKLPKIVHVVELSTGESEYTSMHQGSSDADM